MGEEVPKVMGAYRLLELLASGALTNTYLARRTMADGAPDELVSLKVLRQFADVAPERAALLREATLQELCTHPGVVRVVDHGVSVSEEHGRERFIARKYVSGFSLSELLLARPEQTSGFPSFVVLALGEGLLEVLEAVHAVGVDDGRVLGLIHRDVTPSNVLLGLDGVVYLTDFGLSHAPGAFGLLPDDEVAQGTPRYVTPEAASGEQPDSRSDQFQCALSLLELLGAHARDSHVSLKSILEERLDVPALLPAELGSLASVLARALDPERARRYSTCMKMRAELCKLSAPREAAERCELLASWLDEEFPERVRAERLRVESALDQAASA